VKKSRGQLLSVDFLVAVSLIAVCIGVLLQLSEFAHSRAETAAFLADNEAESIAALLHDGQSARIPAGAVYCARRVLLSGEVQSVHGNCDLFSCGRAVFSARRLESCVNAVGGVEACVLEVRTCC
jgi:hypothetical protein